MANNINYLIVNAPNIPENDPSILIEPVDALTLATWIQHNHNEVSFIDLDRFGINTLNDLTSHYKVALVIFDYLIPLYSSRAIKCFDDLFSAISKIADYILLAGRLATYFSHEILNKFPLLYGCVVGEPEIILADLFKYKNLRLLETNTNIITRESQFNDFKLSFPVKRENIYNLFPTSGPIADRKLCQFNKYIDVHSIISSRGCTGCCKFCSTPGYLGTWRAASPQLVLSEIKHLVNLGAYKIIFLDDNFSTDQSRVRQICKSIKENQINIIWGCLCRIGDVNEQLLDEMHEAGCRWMHFGIEHSDYSNIRQNLGKNFSDTQAIKIIKFAQKIGIRVRTSWILDLPEATSVSVKKTFELAKKISSYEIKLHFLALRPGSEYYNQLKPKKIYDGNDVNEISIHKGQPHNTSSEEFKKDIIEQLNSFQAEIRSLGYQWIPNVAFWKKFNNRAVSPDERFLSCSVMKYGLGWKR